MIARRGVRGSTPDECDTDCIPDLRDSDGHEEASRRRVFLSEEGHDEYESSVVPTTPKTPIALMRVASCRRDRALISITAGCAVRARFTVGSAGANATARYPTSAGVRPSAQMARTLRPISCCASSRRSPERGVSRSSPGCRRSVSSVELHHRGDRSSDCHCWWYDDHEYDTSGGERVLTATQAAAISTNRRTASPARAKLLRWWAPIPWRTERAPVRDDYDQDGHGGNHGERQVALDRKSDPDECSDRSRNSGHAGASRRSDYLIPALWRWAPSQAPGEGLLDTADSDGTSNRSGRKTRTE